MTRFLRRYSFQVAKTTGNGRGQLVQHRDDHRRRKTEVGGQLGEEVRLVVFDLSSSTGWQATLMQAAQLNVSEHIEPVRDPTTVDGHTRSAAVEDVRPKEVAAAGVRCVGLNAIVELLTVEARHADRCSGQSWKVVEHRMVEDFLEGHLEICEVRGVQLEGVREGGCRGRCRCGGRCIADPRRLGGGNRWWSTTFGRHGRQSTVNKTIDYQEALRPCRWNHDLLAECVVASWDRCVSCGCSRHA